METERLFIREFDLSFVESTQRLSVEASNREFMPDEVFETADDAVRCIELLMHSYRGSDGPFVYPIVLKDSSTHIGHVEASKLGCDQWEIGYHIGNAYQNHGYATEAVAAFTPFIMSRLSVSEIYGICKSTNDGSFKVLENCGYILLEETIGKYLGEETSIRRYVYQKKV